MQSPVGALWPAFFLWSMACAQVQPQSRPCVHNCLEEALADDPTKGCPEGTFWMPWPTTAPADACQPCPFGYYCPGLPYGETPSQPVNLNRRVPCPVGTFLNTTGATNLSACTNCSEGRYQDWYGQSECIDCEPGKYADMQGSTAASDCIGCPAAHICASGSPVPVPCPNGTYMRFTSASSTSAAFCEECPKGFFCPLGTVDPIPCPPGTYGNATGITGQGSYPGTFGLSGNVTGHNCSGCPAASFCPEGSVVPTQCPAGTLSDVGAWEEANCTACPVGHRCQLEADPDFQQSGVRLAVDGRVLVGSVIPEVCEVDDTTVHYDQPSITGCVENCPYSYSRQSFCHVAGDGLPPDRSATATTISKLVAQRGRRSLSTEEERSNALVALNDTLYPLSSREALEALTMVDKYGRTPFIQAAMLGDTSVLEMLWNFGAGQAFNASATRDVEGLSALAHALLAGAADAANWLANVANATLAPHEAEMLQLRGVDVSTYPVADLVPAPATLGRGGLTWLHPSHENFTSLGA